MKKEDINKKIKKHEGEIENISLQLDTKASKDVLNLLSFNRYGEIILPSDFYNNITFRIYRDKDGNIQHNFDLNELIFGWKTIYWSNDGADNNDGLTELTPKRSLNGILTLISTLSESNIVVKILSPIIDRTNSSVDVTNKVVNKNIAFISDTETNIGSIEKYSSLSWSKNGNCYQTTRSATVDVWDKKNRDFAGLPIQYKKVTSLSECNNTKGSWFLNGTTLYVRRLDDLEIDEDIMVLVQTGALLFDLQADVKLIFNNINFLCTHSSNPNIKVYSASNKGQLIGVNTNFLGSQSMNGLQIENIKHSWLFNCSAVGTMRDGFNYHNYIQSATSSFAFECNCIAYNNGVRDTNSNNNATTAHDGYRILRIGGIGFNTKGPVLADVNACYSIAYDCTMYDSLLNGTASIKCGFYFDDSTVTDRTTKAYLYNCNGGGVQTYAINTDGIAKVNVHNFKGNNVNTSVINYLE